MGCYAATTRPPNPPAVGGWRGMMARDGITIRGAIDYTGLPEHWVRKAAYSRSVPNIGTCRERGRDVASRVQRTKKNATLSRGVFFFPFPTAKFGRVIRAEALASG